MLDLKALAGVRVDCRVRAGRLRRRDFEGGFKSCAEGIGGDLQKRFGGTFSPLPSTGVFRSQRPVDASGAMRTLLAPTRKRHQQSHRPQRPTEHNEPTQHVKGNG